MTQNDIVILQSVALQDITLTLASTLETNIKLNELHRILSELTVILRKRGE